MRRPSAAISSLFASSSSVEGSWPSADIETSTPSSLPPLSGRRWLPPRWYRCAPLKAICLSPGRPPSSPEPDDLLARFEALPQAIVERKDAVPVIRSLPVQERTLRSTIWSFVPPRIVAASPSTGIAAQRQRRPLAGPLESHQRSPQYSEKGKKKIGFRVGGTKPAFGREWDEELGELPQVHVLQRFSQ